MKNSNFSGPHVLCQATIPHFCFLLRQNSLKELPILSVSTSPPSTLKPLPIRLSPLFHQNHIIKALLCKVQLSTNLLPDLSAAFLSNDHSFLETLSSLGFYKNTMSVLILSDHFLSFWLSLFSPISWKAPQSSFLFLLSLTT